jgi:hypothetical protein
MKLTLVRHLWGVDHTHGLEHHLPRWREVGYEVIESAFHGSPDREALLRLVKHSGWRWIAQVFSRDFTPGGTVKEHLESMRRQIEGCLDHTPWFFNAHSGSDAWGAAEVEDFYGAALELEKAIGVVIAHETHRLRCFGNPWTTRAVLERFPAIKLTCDFSHWVCVAERLLEDCGPIIELAAGHCHHVHARVGYEEGPQVPDPRAPEWARHVAAHEAWWDTIWMAQTERGFPESTLTPEFGPAPYLHAIPYTQAPLANLADVCDWQARRQMARFTGRCCCMG